MWYKSGTIDIVNNSTTLTGEFTFWVPNITDGDILFLNGFWYEIDDVISDTEITLTLPYDGATELGVEYAIIRNFNGSTNADLVTRITYVVDRWQNRENEISAWQAGTSFGGINSDGKYPLTDPSGAVVYAYCPAAISLFAALTHEWATTPEDVEVDPENFPGQYSALHWAAKSEANSIAAVDAEALMNPHYGAIDTVSLNMPDVNTVADDIANVNIVAINIPAIETVADDLNEIISEIETIAEDMVNVNTVGLNIGDVNTVAIDIANVNTVATNIANVNNVWDEISDINTVSDDILNVNTTALYIADVNTVATDLNLGASSNIAIVTTDIANVNIVGTNIASVITTASNIASVNTTATNMADITNVSTASNMTDINTVADDISKVNDVADSIVDVNNTALYIGNVNIVAGDISSVNDVSNSITNVNTTATNIADITTVADDLNEAVSEINTVATDMANVNTTAGSITNVNTVATNIGDVNTVASNIGDVQVLENNIADVNTVATDINNVNLTGGSIANVNLTGGSIANVNLTGGSIGNVNTVATNIVDVNDVGDSIDSVNTVANSIGNVDMTATYIDSVITVANDLTESVSEIDTVANSIDNVDLTGASIADVNTVAGSIGNVNTTADSIANVNLTGGSIANVNLTGASIADVNTVAANIVDVNDVKTNIAAVITVAADLTEPDSEIDTVALNIANVNDVGDSIDNVNNVSDSIANVDLTAGSITSVNTVATNISNVNIAASSIDNINAVGGSINNVNNVWTEITDINTVVDHMGVINIVGTHIDNIDDVATDIENVDQVALNLTAINTVYDDIANVNAVGDSIANVNTVVLNLTNIDKVGLIDSDVTKVANIDSEVTAVAGNETNITTVSGVTGDITTVAGVSTNVTTVAGISGNVTTVAGNSTNVTTVAGISGDVTKVANIDSNVSLVAAVDSDVTAVAIIDSDVTAVANIDSNVTTVANNVGDVNTVATNIVDIQNAEENALESYHWAQRAVDSTVPEGNGSEYSAYHWAQKALNYVSGQMVYRGTHDASGGSYPTPIAAGDYYKISVAGTLSLGDVNIGDSIIYNGTDWDMIDNTEQVTSVAGRVGAVTLSQNDITNLKTTSNPSFNRIISTQATGTAPFTVASTTKVTNLNADLLDGISSASFIRSDAFDEKTSGGLRFKDSIAFSFGNDSDVSTIWNGTNLVTDFLTGNNYWDMSGNFIIRDRSNSDVTRFEVDVPTGEVTAAKFTGVLAGNATTATTLENARTFDIDGDITATGVSFNGSADVTITASVNNNSHTHLSANIVDATTANTANMIVKRDGSGNFSAGIITASLTGNAATATWADTVDVNPSTSGTFHDMLFNNGDSLYSAAKCEIQASTGNIKTAGSLISTVATGTAPLSVTSTTKVANLNVDYLDDQTGSYYLDWANVTNKPDPTITLGGDLTGNLTLTDLGGGTLTAVVVDDSHNHTSLTGVTNIAFATDGSDSASIGTTIDGSYTYFDFNLSDDNNTDKWRWRFTPSSSTVYDAMTLLPVSNGNANLTVSGNIAADNFSGSNSGTNTGDQTNITGNAATATTATTAAAWATGRTITLSGDVTGTSPSWDGSGNLAFANTVVANDSHTHDTRYYTETELTNYTVNPNFATTIGMGNNAVFTYNDNTSNTKTGYWTSQDELKVSGDSDTVIVLKTHNLQLTGSANVVGKVGADSFRGQEAGVDKFEMIWNDATSSIDFNFV